MNYAEGLHFSAFHSFWTFFFITRDTIKGKKYTIWKLSDLSSQSAVVTLFLFGAAFQSHWKTSLGSVVAILNPQNMSDAQVRYVLNPLSMSDAQYVLNPQSMSDAQVCAKSPEHV